MKILHCCLANFYIDNYSYQENIITKMHSLQGHDVKIIASTETYIDNKKIGYVEPKSYINEYGILVKRLPYIDYIPHKVVKKLRIYKGITGELESFKPEIIFLHGLQFISIKEIALYVRKNKETKLYVDNHADFINSANNWISKYILHGIIYKYCAKPIEPYTIKFYGVLPARVNFLKSMYAIPAEKIELLVMGVDDSNIKFAKKNKITKDIRIKLGIADDDFVIITGGKIDKRKNIQSLMNAVIELNLKKLKLIVFGTPDEIMKNEILKLVKNKNIINIGWIEPGEVYDYYFASDLAFFPGTHSVLWEQTVGIGLPAVFKEWDGIKHVDLGGNCLFVKTGEVEEIKNVINHILNDKQLYSKMEEIASNKGIEYFSYSKIAKKAIGL